MRAVLLLSAGLLAMLLLGQSASANMGRPVIPLEYLRKPDEDVKPLEKVPADKVVRVIEKVPVTLTYRSDVERPQLRVPKKFTALEAKPGATLDEGAPSSRTALAGLALSVGFVTGGFWLMRHRYGQRAMPVVLAVLCASLFCTPFFADLAGNAAQIKRPDKLPGRADVAKEVEATVTLEMDITITTDGDRVQLILPKEYLPLNMVPRDAFWGGGGLNAGGYGNHEIRPPR